MTFSLINFLQSLYTVLNVERRCNETKSAPCQIFRLMQATCKSKKSDESFGPKLCFENRRMERLMYVLLYLIVTLYIYIHQCSFTQSQSIEYISMGLYFYGLYQFLSKVIQFWYSVTGYLIQHVNASKMTIRSFVIHLI